jgi:outer membrane receptor protein involved in Fe transport
MQFSEVVPNLDTLNRVGSATLGSDFISEDADRTGNEGYRETGRSDYTEKAIFGEVTRKLDDRWAVTLGGRFFSYSDDAYAKVRDYTGPTSRVSANTVNESGKSYYKFNTSYQLSSDALAYFTFSQGYRRGGANGFRDHNGNTVDGKAQNYLPDSTDNFELGVKGYLPGRRVYAQLALYEIHWKDTQVGVTQTIDGLFPINGMANGPDARSRGFEFSSRFKVNQNWQLTYGTGYTKAEFTEDKTVVMYSNSGDDTMSFKNGDSLWASPRWKHNVGVRYDRYLDSGLSVSATLRGQYVAKLPWNGSYDEYPAYTMYNAGLNFSKNQWDIGFWVDNLTDERAIVSNQAASQIGRRLIFSRPLTVGMNFSYKFN